MRILLFVMILINMGYFFWHYTQSPVADSHAAISPISPKTQRLRLASEMPSLAAKPTASPTSRAARDASNGAAPASRPDDNGAPQMCYTLGPFEDEAAAKQIADRIRDKGLSVSRRAIRGREQASFWVYLPPFEQVDDAESTVEELTSEDIHDYYLIRNGETDEYTISLGIYSSRGRTERRMEQMRKLGYSPKLKIRYQELTYHWLDYATTADKRLASKLWRSIDTDVKAERISRDCQ